MVTRFRGVNPRVPPREDDEMDMDGMGDFSRFPYKKDE